MFGPFLITFYKVDHHLEHFDKFLYKISIDGLIAPRLISGKSTIANNLVRESCVPGTWLS